MRKLLAISGVLILGLGAFVLARVIRQRRDAERLLARESRLAVQDVDLIATRRSVYELVNLPARATFSEFLAKEGLDTQTVSRIVDDSRPVYNLGRVRAGHRVTIVRSGKGDLKAILYQIDFDNVLEVSKAQEGFHAKISSVPYQIRLTGVSGRLHGSLFQAMAEQGEADQLAMEIADIFGWDIDFSTESREGDTFEIWVEKKMLNGQFYAYGRVLAAEYDNAGHPHQAVLFHDPSGRPAYYAPDGKSVQKAFLRSPLKFSARITSGFSYHRFHPILRFYRPHLGVDYGAPVGSAVQAVADGSVVSAGWNGGGGNEVRLRHAKGYETYYLHLSRILVRRGQRVRQGQIIARSGATGLATGPHLDFRVAQHGKFRNFLTLKLPPAQSVAREDWSQFVAVRTSLLDQLASLRLLPNSGADAASLQSAERNTLKSK